VLRVVVSSASAEIRARGLSGDRKDFQRGEVTGRVWTGIVPVWEMMSCPAPTGRASVGRCRTTLRGTLKGGTRGRRGMRRKLLGRCLGVNRKRERGVLDMWFFS